MNEVMIVKWEIMRAVFGERFWTDNEGIICAPVNRIFPGELEQLKSEHGVEIPANVTYLIAEL